MAQSPVRKFPHAGNDKSEQTVYKQADLNLLWVHMSEDTFSHVGAHINLGPVVQSVVSLTSSLRVISLTLLADLIHNILIFFAEKM